MSKLNIGDFELEFKEFDAFETIPFIPFFQRVAFSNTGIRPDLRENISKQAAVLEKKPDNEKAKEQLEKMTSLLQSEVSTSFIRMFKNMSPQEWKEARGFIIKHIKTWNMEVKNDKDKMAIAEINEKSFNKIPRVLLMPLLLNVAFLVLDNGGSEINFSISK